MTNPRDYPDVIASVERSRPLQRGVKMLTIDVDGQKFTYGQPGWWASIDDPADTEDQLTDEDNLIRAAARREARAKAFEKYETGEVAPQHGDDAVVVACREASGVVPQG